MIVIMNKIVKIEGYLTQRKLADALSEIVGKTAWHGSERPVGTKRRFRWDMTCTIHDHVVAVEFDGFEHYWNSLKIKRDLEKDTAAKDADVQVVRIPYWVQLTTETLRYYLNLEAEIDQNFPHGFIEAKIFPASFCELGLKRFTRELETLPNDVRNSVISSLQDRAKEHGAEYVMPSSLLYLLKM